MGSPRLGCYDLVRSEFLKKARATQTLRVAEGRYNAGLLKLEELRKVERVSHMKITTRRD